MQKNEIQTLAVAVFVMKKWWVTVDKDHHKCQMPPESCLKSESRSWAGKKKRDVGKEQIRTAGFKILRGKLNTLETK